MKRLLTLLLTLLAVSVPVYAVNYTVEQITNTTGDEMHVTIADNGHMAWTEDGDIYYWDTTSANKIWSTGTFNPQPELNSNGEVVWWDSGIHYYNGTTHQQVANAGHFRPNINNDGVYTWYGYVSGYQIHYRDTTTNIITPIGSTNNIHPRINDLGHIVWYGALSNNQIFLWDGTNVSQLPDVTNESNRFPDINDLGHVAWTASDGAGYSIYYWDGTHRTKIATNAFNSTYVRINNDGYAVYEGNDGRIYLYDGNGVHKITDYEATRPDINDSGQIVYTGNPTGSNWDVYRVTLDQQPTVPEPASILMLISALGVLLAHFKNRR